MTKRLARFWSAGAAIVLVWPVASAVATGQDRTAQVDAVFTRFTAGTPGCAVGVGLDGRVALSRAYGAADLEHGVPNGAETIFEAASMSKPVFAYAVLKLCETKVLGPDTPR